MPIPFHPLELADKEAIRKMVHDSACRNCDLNFMNLFSWRFLYDTEVAVYKHWLLFRFKADGHNAYMAPVGNGDWRDIVTEMQADAKALGPAEKPEIPGDGEDRLTAGAKQEKGNQACHLVPLIYI